MSQPMVVILEWNQASGLPRVADDTIYDSEREALDEAARMTDAARPRNERYTVHHLDDDPVGGW